VILCHVNLSSAWNLEGRRDLARAEAEEAIRVAREFGFPRAEGVAWDRLGETLLAAGLYAEALKACERSVDLLRGSGDRASETGALGNLGALHVALGRRGSARGILEEGLSLARKHGVPSEADLLATLADLAADEDRPAASKALAEQVLALGQSPTSCRPHVRALLLLGRRRAAEGDARGAREAIAEARAEAEGSGLEDLAVAALGEAVVLDPGSHAALRARLAASEDRLGLAARLRVRFRLYGASGNREDLRAAAGLLDALVRNAPAQDRESMVANVWLHRELAEAWREHRAGEGRDAEGR
jgi:tetratricopeptide (TPR) repeat protein